MTTYRFRYFGKGEFGWRQPALHALADGRGYGHVQEGRVWDFNALVTEQVGHMIAYTAAMYKAVKH
eukprot:SAG31_NODE_4962_length_2834_cov_1.541865_1_plen_65_part_10